MTIHRGTLSIEALLGERAQEQKYSSPNSCADNPSQEGVIPGWMVDGLPLGKRYNPASHGYMIFKIVGADGTTLYHGEEPSDNLVNRDDNQLLTYWIKPNFVLGEE